MPHLRILCIGRNAKDPLLKSADLYLERLSKFSKVELLRLREGTLEFEQKQIEARLGSSGHLICLDERGKELRTRQVADKLEGWDMDGVSPVTFLIGGANGLSSPLKERSKELWSLSQMTLPHRLAQVLLLEQLYRAFTINHGMPYHRD